MHWELKALWSPLHPWTKHISIIFAWEPATNCCLLSFSACSADIKAGLQTPPPSAGPARPVGKGEFPSGSGDILWPSFSCFSGLTSCRNSFSRDALPHSGTTSSVQQQELPRDTLKPVPRPGSSLWTTSPCTPEGGCPAGSTNISPQRLQHHCALHKEAWISDLSGERGAPSWDTHLSPGALAPPPVCNSCILWHSPYFLVVNPLLFQAFVIVSNSFF